jgi:hypothetical protein
VRLLTLSGAVFAFSVLGTVTALAQSPSPPTASPSAPQSAPLRGFVPPYEILRTVRAAGFDPLAPPLREGTSYVVRAIDFRGVAMRVVVDAHSGAIRDANRIVSGPGLYGPYAPGPYPPAPYGRFGPPRYLAPADEVAAYGRPPYVGASEVPLSDQDELRGLAPARPQYSTGASLVPSLVPLPRPRPAGLTAAGLAAAGLAAAGLAAAGGGETKSGETKSIVKPMATGTSTAPRSEPLSKPTSASAIPAIND